MITYKRELVTPQRARQFLDNNAKNNRNMRPTKIQQYARDMKNGRWDPNTGQTIKVTVEGIMLDGQNRMAAVIESGTAIYFDIAYDVPETSMIVMDTGAARTAADALKVSDADERMVNSAIVRWAIMWDNGVPVGHGGGFAPTISEINERYRAEPELFDAAALRGADARRAGLGTGSVAGVAYYLFARIDQEACHQFFDQLVSGANLPERSATLTLRNRLARLKVDRLKRPEQLALFVRGWNAFREKRPLERLSIVRAGELNNLNFPRPK